MNVNRMRFIDKWAGIPLCTALSLVNFIRRIFSSSSPLHKPKSILFIELSEMGSMVLAYPMFKKARKLFPEASLYFLTFQDNRYAIDILDIIPDNNVFTIKIGSLFSFLLSTAKTLIRLRKIHLDVAIDMEYFSRFTSLLSYLSGAKKRVGYHRFHSEGLYRGNLLTHRVALNPQIHTAHNFLNLIQALISSPHEVPLTKRPLDIQDIFLPRYTTSEAAKKNLRAKLTKCYPEFDRNKKIVLLNPNASDIIPLRRWPIDNYIDLARKILQDSQALIVITGVHEEKALLKNSVRRLDQNDASTLPARPAFKELMDLYTLSDILVTNDSGPAHFSTMADIATIVFFGPETPRLYGPLGKKCHVMYADYSTTPVSLRPITENRPVGTTSALRQFPFNKFMKRSKKSCKPQDTQGSGKRRAILLVLIYLALIFLFFLRIKDDMVDFEVNYQAGKRLRMAETLYRTEDGHYQFKYFPCSALVYAPLSHLPLETAKAVWFILVILSISLILYKSAKMVRPNQKASLYLIFFTTLILGKFILREIDLGQINAVVTLILVLMIQSMDRNKETAAGFYWGLAVALKPYSAIFLPYLLIKKSWRSLASGFTLIFVALLTPSLYYGIKGNMMVLKEWFFSLSQSTPHLLTTWDNVSVLAFYSKWTHAPNLSLILYLLTVALLAFLVLFVIIKGNKATHPVILEGALLLLLTPLVSPLGWDYTLISAALAIMLILNQYQKYTRPWKIFLVVNVGVLSLSVYDLIGRTLFERFMSLSIITLNALILVGYLVWIRLRNEGIPPLPLN